MIKKYCHQLFIGFTLLLIATTHQLALAGGPFSDEFNDYADLLNNNTTAWSVLGAEINDSRALSLSIDQGALTVEPEIFAMNAWFEDQYGPLVYQNVSGNFAVAIALSVTQSTDPEQPADLGFNAGGFVIRDANGSHNGDENWVMYNMGGQGQNGVTYAREMKKTVNSVSNLYLTEQVGVDEYLLACRVGHVFYFYYWADAIGAWRQETFYNQFDVDGANTTTWRNSGSVTAEINVPAVGQSSPMHFDHAGMPDTVQLGIMGHSWQNGDNGLLARFDFIRFAPSIPQSQNDCTQAFLTIDELIFADDFE
ncbi:hypothetical protein OS175_02515 [Marinicella sp. S1101]|uniref:hypothetical protein n=1 Tax=Marinicella marina TaxID=2996016 RepID=UPI002260F7E7|nr:hypothetical protein [Marinicella marina]MCX7552740.1 hypothetical protein [Marinicella marina]MDJ1139951.1 hypothetical protein [Marinicella marina]